MTRMINLTPDHVIGYARVLFVAADSVESVKRDNDFPTLVTLKTGRSFTVEESVSDVVALLQQDEIGRTEVEPTLVRESDQRLAQVRGHLLAGHVIPAIKELRAQFGTSLRVSKDFIESMPEYPR
ncbi:hypothetical protein [Telmatospirillum sp.]|uniref:hypothetical protein n=1 Tax=Telmatospirillum sp. TaxID=2079197 RepID=UPI00283BE528|nr:hypothetical protein [Telmatospirillum sp.]MDR3436407.1 hypothetical protein [Telmatospirillum sp.]